jgi:hypothetical protein
MPTMRQIGIYPHASTKTGRGVNKKRVKNSFAMWL